VLAYNPKTGKMELEPILHVWINHDHDLVDLTITTTAKGQHGKVATKTSEVVHTTSEHPFFTAEQGFVAAGKLKLGMHVLRADGSVGMITGWKAVPGTQVMYNLEVANDHTFTVGSGQWVVHNACNRPLLRSNLKLTLATVQAHHIVPCDLESMGIVDLAINNGYDFNSADNGIGLPIFRGGKLPQHLGSHPDYTDEVWRLLWIAQKGLARQYGGHMNIPPPVAETAFRQITNYIRGIITSAGGNCTINEVTL